MIEMIIGGSLALVAAYVGVQSGTASKAQQGGNALVSLMRHALSGDVAGIPDHSKQDGPKSFGRRLTPG